MCAGFNEERVRGSITKMQAAKSTSVQNRLTSYFGTHAHTHFLFSFCLHSNHSTHVPRPGAPVKKPTDKAAGKAAKSGKADSKTGKAGKTSGTKQPRESTADGGSAAKKAKEKKSFTGK